MSTDRERRTFTACALALVFAAATVGGVHRFVVTLAEDADPVAWAHAVHLLSSGTAALCGLWGLALMAAGHHRRAGTSSLVGGGASPPEASHADEHELAMARAVIRTFALTVCLLLLGTAVAAYVATYPEEPAFVRVIATTVLLISFLWLVGAVASRMRAGRRAGRG